MPEKTTKIQSSTGRKIAQRLGIGVFLFFLIKGMLWLIVPAILAAYVYLKTT